MVEAILLVIVLIAVVISALIVFRPKSKWHSIPLSEAINHKLIIAIALVITVICCTVPMNLSPLHNGEIPEIKNQYEKITESFLDGHLDFGYVVDEDLLALDNPYDPESREQANVEYYWDHSFYNGKYYMSFGVVPVLITFLPYRVITGHSLTTYHATQLYVALFIIGLFYCFYLLGKKWFKELPVSVYISLSVAFSVMSVWVAVSRPAMYCTAMTAGMMMMIWSVTFWIKAAWLSTGSKKSLTFAVLGSLFGALVFGCRPIVGLANLLILPLMYYYIRNNKIQKQKALKVVLFLCPYIIIGALLMLYNYVRFDSVFEFGQSYQLTMVDVKNAPGLFNSTSLKEKLKVALSYAVNILKYLFDVDGIDNLLENGTFITFPILLYIVIGLENESIRNDIKVKRIRGFVIALIATPMLILLADVVGSPIVASRYRMDTYWVLGMFAYVMIGFYYKYKTNKPRFSYFICLLGVITILTSVLLFAYPFDSNFTAYYLGRVS